MPDTRFLMLLLAVMAAAGLTILAFATAAPQLLPWVGLLAIAAALLVRFRP